MTWVSSMDGVPWTPKKMRQAVTHLREGATVTFAFRADPLDKLRQLDAEVFRRRPDLVLHTWSTADDRRLSDEDLATLTACRNVRRLRVSGIKSTRLDPIGVMRWLETLAITADLRLGLAFVERLDRLRSAELWAKIEQLDALARCKRLTDLRLAGTLGDVSPLAACKRLRSLAFGSSTIRSLAFVSELARLEKLSLDTATIAGKLDPIGTARGLVELSLTNNRNVRDVDFIGELVRLQRLRVDQPLVTRLPNLTKLTRLEELFLRGMKAWTNPEVLEALPRLRSLDIVAANPKLRADRFFFLATSKKLRSLEKVDLRFIDFGKRRRAALEAHFAKVGKKGLLAK